MIRGREAPSTSPHRHHLVPPGTAPGGGSLVGLSTRTTSLAVARPGKDLLGDRGGHLVLHPPSTPLHRSDLRRRLKSGDDMAEDALTVE